MAFLPDFLDAIVTTITTILPDVGTGLLGMFNGAFTTDLGAISSLGVMAGIVIGLGVVGGAIAWVQSKI